MTTKNKRYRTERGFTLVELLVVLGIISILSALSLGSLSELKAAVYRTTNKAVVRDIYTAIEAGYAEVDKMTGNYNASWRQGTLIGGNPTVFAPGVKSGNNYISVLSYPDLTNTNCPACTRVYIYVRECGSREARSFVELTNGTRTETNITDPSPSC